MVARRNSILILLFILGLILFDAVQQRYYINSFQLTTEPVLLGNLLKSHFIRWSIWGLMGIPFGAFVWKKLRSDDLGLRNYLLIFAIAVFSIFISVLLISFIEIWRQDLEISNTLIKELVVFFSYQKGLTFFMAYGTMTILLYTHYQTIQVKAKDAEIVNLMRTSEELEKNLQSNEQPFLSIKTGNKINPIALTDIIWIQADDYCVRIHTEDRAYTLRKSLKALEVQLKPFRFIRIHRGALLNLHYVDQINFESSTIRLQNDRELPLSRSGIKTLKKRIKESTL